MRRRQRERQEGDDKERQTLDHGPGQNERLADEVLLVIEVGQLFRPSRTTDITDVLLNSLGVILVVRLFARWGRV